MNEERVKKLIAKALELQEQGSSQVSSSDLIEISQELQIDSEDLRRAQALIEHGKEILDVEQSMEETLRLFHENMLLREGGFCDYELLSDQSDEAHRVYRVRKKFREAPLSPSYILSFRKMEEGKTRLSWTLHLQKYQESTFLFCIASVLFCILFSVFGNSPGTLFFLPTFLYVIYYSRTGAKDDLHKEVLKDLTGMQELKLPDSENRQAINSVKTPELSSGKD